MDYLLWCSDVEPDAPCVCPDTANTCDCSTYEANNPEECCGYSCDCGTIRCCGGVPLGDGERCCNDESTIASKGDSCGCEEDREADPCNCGVVACCGDGSIPADGQVCCAPADGGKTTATSASKCCGGTTLAKGMECCGGKEQYDPELKSKGEKTIEAPDEVVGKLKKSLINSLWLQLKSEVQVLVFP